MQNEIKRKHCCNEACWQNNNKNSNKNKELKNKIDSATDCSLTNQNLNSSSNKFRILAKKNYGGFFWAFQILESVNFKSMGNYCT